MEPGVFSGDGGTVLNEVGSIAWVKERGAKSIPAPDCASSAMSASAYPSGNISFVACPRRASQATASGGAFVPRMRMEAMIMGSIAMATGRSITPSSWRESRPVGPVYASSVFEGIRPDEPPGVVIGMTTDTFTGVTASSEYQTNVLRPSACTALPAVSVAAMPRAPQVFWGPRPTDAGGTVRPSVWVAPGWTTAFVGSLTRRSPGLPGVSGRSQSSRAEREVRERFARYRSTVPSGTSSVVVLVMVTATCRACPGCRMFDADGATSTCTPLVAFGVSAWAGEEEGEGSTTDDATARIPIRSPPRSVASGVRA